MSICNLKSMFRKTLLFWAIKILYVFLTVYLLDGLWYTGYGSYGIDFVLLKELLGTVVFLFMALFFTSMQSKGTFIDSLMTMLFVLYYIPLNSAFSINNTDFLFFLKSNIYYFLILLCVRWFIKTPKNKATDTSLEKNDLIYKVFDPAFVRVMCVSVCVFCIVYKIMYNGFSFSLSLSSDDIYSTRGEFQTSLDAMSGSLFSYVFSIVRNLADMIIPLYLYYSITQKKFFGFVLSTLSLLSMFSVKSSKTSLIFVLVVLVIVVLRKTKFIKKFSTLFTVGILALLLVCLFETLLFDSSKIYMLLIRRVLYYPAWLNSLYVDFFSQNAKVMWTQDTFLLQMVFSPQYPQGILSTISNYFYNGQIPSPNTGMFAEAYMHWGELGIAIYPMILTALMVFSNKVFSKYGEPISILVAVKLVLKLTNVPLVRTDFMLSYVLFVVLISFLPRLVFQRRMERASPENALL